MIDKQATQTNEKVLHEFLRNADKTFVTQVGIISLALLTEQFSTEQYQEFLTDCIDNAAELHKAKLLGVKNVTGSPSAVPEGPDEDENEQTGDSTNG
jgi:hypothetical protein